MLPSKQIKRILRCPASHHEWKDLTWSIFFTGCSFDLFQTKLTQSHKETAMMGSWRSLFISFAIIEHSLLVSFRQRVKKSDQAAAPRTNAGEPSPIPTQLIQHDALNDYDQPRLNQLITEHESVSKCGEGLLPALVIVGSKAMSLYFAVHRSVIRSTSCTAANPSILLHSIQR